MKEGKWVSMAPFGYHLTTKGILEIYRETLPFAKKVFSYFLGDKMGAKTIARRLRQEDHCTKRSGHWATNSVWNMLKNPVYAGLYRVDGELVKAPHEGIITPEQFNQIQNVLTARTRVAPWH